jgi:hypothetical protein
MISSQGSKTVIQIIRKDIETCADLVCFLSGDDRCEVTCPPTHNLNWVGGGLDYRAKQVIYD